MILEGLLKGESKNIEYKSELPRKSERYMKSIIAFANTSGGRLIIGIDDNTREVVGVQKDSVFQIMDGIANAVSDSCEPQIIPDITFQNIDGKCVVIVEIYPGTNRPYYLKCAGKSHGVYVRVAGTSRLADDTKIKELEIEGANQSWDELVCVGYPVTEEAIDKLCKDIYEYMFKSMGEERKDIPKVTVEQMINWKLLKKSEGKLLSTNGFALLTSDYFRFARIQCALFKGNDRDEFIDKKEYSGPLYEQIEGAYQFVLRHINRSAEIDGLVRKEKYELPTAAIREMIINAQCHRNFLDNSCIQVALYDDRLEVTSPGMLYGGLTLEEAVRGRSKIRNRVVAEVFSRMDLIEEWGTGLRRILKRAGEYGLPEPEFLEIGDTFRVNLYRPGIKKADTNRKPIKKADTNKKPIKKADTNKKPIKKADKEQVMRERQQTIIKYIEQHENITNREARDLLGLAASTTKRILKQMVEEKLLTEQGERRMRTYIKSDL